MGSKYNADIAADGSEVRGFYPLNEESLIEYVKSTPALAQRLGNDGNILTAKEVGDGNLNFVYIVIGAEGSFVLKQIEQEANEVAAFFSTQGVAELGKPKVFTKLVEFKSYEGHIEFTGCFYNKKNVCVTYVTEAGERGQHDKVEEAQ